MLFSIVVASMYINVFFFYVTFIGLITWEIPRVSEALLQKQDKKQK